MIDKLELLYLAVGLGVIITIIIVILVGAFVWTTECIERIRRPIWKEETIRLYKNLATVFEHKDKKISHLFIKLMENNIKDVKSNPWDLRDEFDKD